MSMSVEDVAAAPRTARPIPNTPENVLEQFSMRGKVTVVSGASEGIGFAVAEAIAEAGGDVALWYNSNPAAVTKGEQLAKQHGIRTKAYQVQISDPDQVEKAISSVVNDFGKLDVFIANAGRGSSKPILEQSIDEYKQVMSVNGMKDSAPRRTLPSYLTFCYLVDGVFYCAKYAGLVFKKQGFGAMIINSSISAHIVNVPLDQGVGVIQVRYMSSVLG